MSFSQWCEQQSLSAETEKTINAITKALNVKNCAEAAEIAPRVFTLTIANQNISDLRPLKSFINLTDLNLYNNNIVDISPLQSMTNLKKVVLGHNPIQDLTPLKSLNNLEKLYISNINTNNFEAIKYLKKLILYILIRIKSVI